MALPRPPRPAADRRRSCDPQAGFRARRWLLHSPPWALALALHLLAAVVLMNIVEYAARPRAAQVFRISLSPPGSMDPPGGGAQGVQDNGVHGQDNEDSPPAGPVDPADPARAGAALPDLPSPAPSLTLEPASLLASPPGPAPSAASGTGTSGALGPGGLLSGRGGAGRGELLRRNGGGADTERAVVDGLDWLARHQSPDGSWGSSTHTCPRLPACSGPGCDSTVASTAFALLAFAGHGVTHKDGAESAWAPVVDRGLRFILKSQRDSGLLVTPAWSSGSDMYVHAAATLAMAELSAMTQDPCLRRPLLKAVDYIASRQQSCGGWDYQEGMTGRGDASISALVVQAIRAARAAGVVVPRLCWEEACRFYETVLIPATGRIAYQVNPGDRWAGVSGSGRSLDAAGHFARRCLSLRESPEVRQRVDAHLRQGCPALAYGGGLNGHPVYFMYYATLYFFSEGGSQWTRWNDRLKEELLPAQARVGCARGSWDPAGTDLEPYGRAILTAFCVLNLEIYYRYLPSSSQDTAAYARLGEGAGDDTETLILRLDSPAMDIRRAAARRLENRDEERVFEALADAAVREKTSLRELLVRSLGKFAGSPARRVRLARFLEEGERDAVRREAEGVLEAWAREK